METKNPLNILFFSPTVPYPAIDGGRIRVSNLVSRLCKTNKVTFLTFIALPSDEEGSDYLRQMGIDVIGVRLKHQSQGVAILKLLSGIIQRKPLTIAKYYSTDMLKTLKNLLESKDFHVIHFEMLHTGQYISKLDINKSNCSTFLGQQNIDSHIWNRLANTEKNPLKKMLFYSQYKAFKRYESRICDDFNACLCVSEQDKAILSSLCPRSNIAIIPNGVDLEYFAPVDVEEDEKSLVFTGSMDWHPNEDAVLYFCQNIFPIIKAEIPEIKFYIVGSNPTQRVLKLKNITGVFVTGSVEDVRPYIADSAVYVVPLRIGGGTRLKILQALAMQKAVVSTSIGCEGQELIPGEHLMVSDNSQEFARIVIQLLKDRNLRQNLGKNGRIFVQQKYDWDIIARDLDQFYRKYVFL